ncbi:MAG: phosphate ABC transporter substrate-binding protein [Planctomycetota bacterium]|nr:phosphate ABC transporter substrate-binding protein [Planctomycetota bacterium]
MARLRLAAMPIAAFAILLAATSCGQGDRRGAKGRTVTIKGSDTMVILGQRWAENYMRKNPGAVIQVTGGGSGVGIAALINGGTDICAASRPMKDKEKEQAKARHGREAVETAVALDGIAVFLNEANPVDELSLEQIEAIYTGGITDWKDVGGPAGRIVCYGRENNSGTYMYFKEHVLRNRDFASDVQTLPGTAAVINAVLKDKSAIGYGGIGYAKGVKAIRVASKAGEKGVTPDMEHVVAGTYPISRKLFFYTIGEPIREAKAFIEWVLSEEGQNICEQVGYYPVRKRN